MAIDGSTIELEDVSIGGFPGGGDDSPNIGGFPGGGGDDSPNRSPQDEMMKMLEEGFQDPEENPSLTLQLSKELLPKLSSLGGMQQTGHAFPRFVEPSAATMQPLLPQLPGYPFGSPLQQC